MSERSEAQRSLEWTSYAEASPVRTSRKLETERASTENAPDSGAKCAASSTSSGRRSSSSKTLLRSLREGWIECSAISEGSAIEWRPASSPRPTLALRTSASDCSSWPTPVARDAKGVTSANRNTPSLPDAVRRWPTPTRGDAESSARHTTTTGKSHDGTTLTDAVRMWPTPTASDYGSSNNGDPGDGRGAFATAGKASLSTMARRSGGHLNPRWVEALMGFPDGWTDGPLDLGTLPLFGNRREP